MAAISIDDIIEVAFMQDKFSPIDWDKLRNGKEHALRLVASSVIEQFEKPELDDDARLIMLATITKLLVENMILHTKLLATPEK